MEILVFSKKGTPHPLIPFANLLQFTQISMADFSADIEHYQAQMRELEERIKDIKRYSSQKVRALYKEINEYRRIIRVLKQMEAEHVEQR